MLVYPKKVPLQSVLSLSAFNHIIVPVAYPQTSRIKSRRENPPSLPFPSRERLFLDSWPCLLQLLPFGLASHGWMAGTGGLGLGCVGECSVLGVHDRENLSTNKLVWLVGVVCVCVVFGTTAIIATAVAAARGPLPPPPTGAQQKSAKKNRPGSVLFVCFPGVFVEWVAMPATLAWVRHKKNFFPSRT